jgi:integrase
MSWLPWPVLPKRHWPNPEYRDKRAITLEEHETILKREPNPEWRAYFAILWFIGGAQTDVALLRGEDIDWPQRVITYFRKKTKTPCFLSIGNQLEALLRALPASGPLFPRISQLHEMHRAKHFRRRCLGLGITDISLHSYRYAWAERAKSAGMPERFAMENIGHTSRAIHRSYALKAQVTIPALEAYERNDANSKILPRPTAGENSAMPVPASSGKPSTRCANLASSGIDLPSTQGGSVS